VIRYARDEDELREAIAAAIGESHGRPMPRDMRAALVVMRTTDVPPMPVAAVRLPPLALPPTDEERARHDASTEEAARRLGLIP
jgi:hypothetical protein